jgi:hypothetical protein
MTQKDKDLLLNDLCARLRYGVKISVQSWDEREMEYIDKVDVLYSVNGDEYIKSVNEDYDFSLEDIKPYLFPISSMSEEQKNEYNRWKHEVPVCHYEYGEVVEEVELYDSPESFEYLIENHFDYHGLIPMGLANDATGLNVY